MPAVMELWSADTPEGDQPRRKVIDKKHETSEWNDVHSDSIMTGPAEQLNSHHVSPLIMPGTGLMPSGTVQSARADVGPCKTSNKHCHGFETPGRVGLFNLILLRSRIKYVRGWSHVPRSPLSRYHNHSVPPMSLIWLG